MADDAVFSGNGDNLHPVKETSIELKKEILSFKISENYVSVNVYFEFYNPGRARNLLVGFVTGAPGGTDAGFNECRIKEFTVIFNDKSLKYELRNLDSEFVFIFNAHFTEGWNIVQHSYLLPPSGEAALYNYYAYTITTGKSWANHEIEDFQLDIDLGSGLHYYPGTFWKSGKPVDWKIIGTGKKVDSDFHTPNFLDKALPFKAYIQSGYVSFLAKHFKPDYDFKFGTPDYCHWVSGESEYRDMISTFLDYCSSEYNINDNTAEKTDLDLLEKFVYALHGYTFQDKETADFFNSIYWYMPNYSLKKENIMLTNYESKLIRKISEYKKKKKFGWIYNTEDKSITLRYKIKKEAVIVLPWYRRAFYAVRVSMYVSHILN